MDVVVIVLHPDQFCLKFIVLGLFLEYELKKGFHKRWCGSCSIETTSSYNLVRRLLKSCLPHEAFFDFLILNSLIFIISRWRHSNQMNTRKEVASGLHPRNLQITTNRQSITLQPRSTHWIESTCVTLSEAG